MGHLGHDEAMETGGREFSLHGQVVSGMGHLGHDEVWRREVVISASMAKWFRVWDLGHDEAI